MEIIVKGTQSECEKLGKCFAELSLLESCLAPMVQSLLGVPMSFDVKSLLSYVRYEPEVPNE